MNSGPQRTAIGKPDAVMISTMSLRLGDHLFGSPNAVVDQSLLAIRPAISFFVEGAVGGRFAPLSSNDILITAYGNWRETAKHGLKLQGYLNMSIVDAVLLFQIKPMDAILWCSSKSNIRAKTQPYVA